MSQYNLYLSNDDGSGEVGIWFINNELRITFPKNYSYNNLNLYNDLYLLSSCLEKYFKISSQNNVNTNAIKDFSIEGQKEFSFISYFNIINQYIENGYYHEIINSIETNGKGNINFVKTINKFSPFIINDNCLFMDHITNSKKISLDNALTDIHRYVVEQSFKVVGCFYPQIEYDINCFLPFSTEDCINFLQQTILETFNDEKRLFFETLLSFFKIKKVDESNITFYSSKKFDSIWEVMLRDLLGNVDISNFYFNSYWNLSNTTKTNTPSRPDIVHINLENTLTKSYIIDAKYFTYSLSNTKGTLPGTSDINKQILYKHYVENVVPKNYISDNYEYMNCFILPCESSNDKVNYLGYAISDFNTTEKVHAFSVDIKYVMYNYINIHQKYSFSKFIFNFIDNYI